MLRLLLLVCLAIACGSRDPRSVSGGEPASPQRSADTASIRLCSWNLRDFGNSKNEAEIAFIAATLRNYDLVLIQEVVTGPGGPASVARLADALNRTGTRWDYRLSNPTSGAAYKSERYAFLWKPARVQLQGSPWLEQRYGKEIDREPYLATFRFGSGTVTLANFHAITKSKQPETEVKYFRYLPAVYPGLRLLFCGDFNLPSAHSVFNPLKGMGYRPALVGQKTTLKRACRGRDCLASEFDNLFYPASLISVTDPGIDRFYERLPSMEAAHRISDHVPVYATLRSVAPR